LHVSSAGDRQGSPMGDRYFDIWLKSLERAEGCQENAVRAYVLSLRSLRDEVRDVLVDATGLEHLDTLELAQRLTSMHAEDTRKIFDLEDEARRRPRDK